MAIFLAGYFLAINIVTFFLFLIDKMISGGPLRRVPERVLFLFVILGGTPAAMLAMALFRHKTRKAPFQAVMLLVFLLQMLAAFVFWKMVYWEKFEV